ncbi:MAG: hypothetical protein KatS3mg111_2091 [Pirellulaceae bacterium]|nr:MAG: hypothetical protein KatS3mg111_2091 [Pirellulaceae bacterium]
MINSILFYSIGVYSIGVDQPIEPDSPPSEPYVRFSRDQRCAAVPALGWWFTAERID